MIHQQGHVIDVRTLSEVEFRALVLSHLAMIVQKLQELDNASDGTGSIDGGDSDDARGTAGPNGGDAPAEAGAPGELEAPPPRILRPF